MSRATREQRTAEIVRQMTQLREAYAIVSKGVCPQCGAKLHRNLSMSGWWQCDRFGEASFRRAPGPQCNFQIFYDPTPEQHNHIVTENRV
jgi:ribosomal protein L37AE/L43A